MIRVFVSYSHADAALVRPIVQLLRANRSFVFQDIDSIEPGSRWRRAVSRGLAEANLVLVFWSKHAADSVNVAAEWHEAITLEKDLLPILLDATPIPDGLADFQWIDFRGVSHVSDHNQLSTRRETSRQRFVHYALIAVGAWIASPILVYATQMVGVWDPSERAAPRGGRLVRAVATLGLLSWCLWLWRNRSLTVVRAITHYTLVVLPSWLALAVLADLWAIGDLLLGSLHGGDHDVSVLEGPWRMAMLILGIAVSLTVAMVLWYWLLALGAVPKRETQQLATAIEREISRRLHEPTVLA